MRTSTSSSKVLRVLGAIVAISGIVFFVAGAVTYGAVASNLKAEAITVSPDAKAFGGQTVDTPWEAFAQADIINHHALAATGDRTYAELGAEMHDIEAANPDLDKAALAAENADYAELSALRTVVMNGSFLRASLFTSVIAFGVGALVMGVGVVFAIVGFAIRSIATPGTDVAPAAAAATQEPALV